MTNNLKLTLGLSLLCTVFSFNINAQTCGATPDCATLGFTYTTAQCGSLAKIKCPFADAYFCDLSCPSGYVESCNANQKVSATLVKGSKNCYTCVSKTCTDYGYYAYSQSGLDCSSVRDPNGNYCYSCSYPVCYNRPVSRNCFGVNYCCGSGAASLDCNLVRDGIGGCTKK